jgi:uncharacterized membrane protein YfcA
LDLLVILIIVLTSIIQSLLGIGVLLFGTPLLLLLGYSFFECLLIVLPVSVSINIVQIMGNYRFIDFKIYKKILFFTVPLIILSLLLMDRIIINVSIIIGIFLLFLALKDYVVIIERFMNKILSYKKSYYIMMGVVHGITNLGGALLTAIVFNTNLNKFQKRATIAASYMTFAFFQIVTITYLDQTFNKSNLIYVIIGLLVYLVVNKLMFNKISDSKYNILLSIFLIGTGILLILKST